MRFIVALTALATALVASAKADPIATCAVAPVPPVACSTQNAQCICDANGNCRWLYNCTHPTGEH